MKFIIRAGVLAAALIASPLAAQDCTPEIAPFFGAGSFNGGVYSVSSFDDGTGTGPAIYLGGAFTKVGGLEIPRLVRWNGANWSDVGGGVGTSPNEIPYVMTVYDPPGPTGPVLVAGGAFLTAGGKTVRGLATWDGAQWNSLGGGVFGGIGLVRALCIADIGDGSRLYVGGSFTNTDFGAAANIVSWDGAKFEPLGAGVSGEVRAIASHNDGGGTALFATGNFTTAGGQSAKYIAKWKSGAWTPLAAGLDLQGNSLAEFDDGGGKKLYVAGNFFNAGGQPASRIARWNGSQWSTLGDGVGGSVNAIFPTLRPADNKKILIATGEFQNAGGKPAANIAVWDGASWSAVGQGVSSVGRALAPDPLVAGRTLVGGEFTNADGIFSAAVARTDSLSLSQVYTGADNIVRDFIRFDDGSGTKTYFGGDFKAIGGIKAPGGVARFDGATWEAMPGLGTGGVWRFATYDHDGDGRQSLIAGGRFTALADGTVAHKVARWDEISLKWNAFGGVSGDQNALIADIEVLGGSLVVTGQFNKTSDGVPIANLARYNGTQWTGIGQGLTGQGAYGAALQPFDGDGDGEPSLIIGGRFDFADGAPAKNLAELGASFSPLIEFRGGVNGDVYALDSNPGDRQDDWHLLIAGTFTAGGNGAPTLNHIARVVADGPIEPILNGQEVGLPHPIADIAYFDPEFNGYDYAVASDPPGDPGQVLFHDNSAGEFYLEIEGDAIMRRIRMTRDIGIQPTEELWIGGGFAVVNGVSSGGFARFACSDADACYPDLDGSGVLDLFDFLAFVNLFNVNDPKADCDANAAHDLFDFLCFVNAFNAGC